MARGLGEIAGAVIGGVGGVLIADRLMREWTRSERAALAVAVGGGLAAIALRGKAKSVAVGASAACAGQLTLMWLHARTLSALPGNSTVSDIRERGTDSRAPTSPERDQARARQPMIEMPVENRGEGEPQCAVEPVALASPDNFSDRVAENASAARRAHSQAAAGQELGPEPADLENTP
jgi:hypothetical protein